MNINLYLNYYKDPALRRRNELDLCVANNINNNLLNVVILESNKRPKYKEFFTLINSYSDNNDINIISNLDIYFDNSVEKLKEMTNQEAFVLGRWDVLKNGSLKFANRPDSQDAWVFKGKIKQNLFGDFCLGYPGCDNRIAYEMDRAGYRISNPSKTIKAIHMHVSMVRNYKAKGRGRKQFEVGGPYKTITPCEWEKRKR